MLPRAIPAMLIASVLAFVGACATVPEASGTAPVVASIIVKPLKPAAAEAVERAAREALGPGAGVRYARPLAGDAHLLYLTAPATRDEVPALVERLRASNAFEYVERDSIMKIQ
jgi:cell division septation protein DedD